LSKEENDKQESVENMEREWCWRKRKGACKVNRAKDSSQQNRLGKYINPSASKSAVMWDMTKHPCRGIQVTIWSNTRVWQNLRKILGRWVWKEQEIKGKKGTGKNTTTDKLSLTRTLAPTVVAYSSKKNWRGGQVGKTFDRGNVLRIGVTGGGGR